MKKATELHNEAMRYAELAFVAKFEGNTAVFEENSLKAYELETQAANFYRSDFLAEPTRSVLYRSAAVLAMDCKKYPEAIRLIEIGLGGDPPEKIAGQLRELLEQANSFRPLKPKNLSSTAEKRLKSDGAKKIVKAESQ